MITSIQFLRALAALMVVGFHAAYTANAYGGYVFAFNNAGAAGVDIFFVISGFIITYVTRDSMGASAAEAMHFMARRLIRIAPPYWFYTSITVASLLVIPAAYANLKFDTLHVLLSYFFLLSSNNVNAIGTVLGVGWSLCYEFYFYLLFAVFMLAPKRFMLPGIACVLVVGALLERVLQVPPFAQVALSALPLEFLSGCLLAKCYLRGKVLPGMPAVAAIGLGLALIYWAGAARIVETGRDSWRVLYFGVPALCVAAGVLSLDARRLIRFPRFAMAIGDASYSLYLSHQFVMFGIGKCWALLGLHQYVPAVVFLLAATLASMAFGMLSYRWLELPITRRLQQGWRPQRAIAI